MQFNTLAILFSLSALGLSENTVERDDVPGACLGSCQFVIDLSSRCDQQTDGDDSYRRCVCGEPDSRARLTDCAVCVKDNGMRDPDDNDVADLMDDCGWDFNDAVPTSTLTSSAMTTPVAVTPSVSTTIIVSTSGSVTVTTTRVTTGTAVPDATTSSVPTGAAAKATVGIGYAVAGLAMAIPAFV
ncbi:hypothetical protein F4778DRAFT_763570 [Xylariomycetidae sp. FL2044]|nr:hypothetical protein F4778DRAFT_763570 [Xylariomycetidae sp. FL2044]